MKILKVSATNFKLCEDNFTISFVPTANKTRDDKEFELQKIAEDLYTFSTISIVGKNASGKTTAIELLFLIHDIFSNFRVKSSSKIFRFISQPVSIDITFFHQNNLYRYTLDLYKKDYPSDSIFFKNQKLYTREYKKSYSKNLFDYSKYELLDIKSDLPEDTSILFTLLRNSTNTGFYFDSYELSSQNYNYAYILYDLVHYLTDIKTSITSKIIKMFDEHIKEIIKIHENKFQIVYYNKNLQEVSSNELFEILSSGTTKGFCLFALVILSLQLGADLIIDEIENHFHKTLVENLINLYKDKSVNKKNATLVFTTHNCELLDLFNRNDNIYISRYTENIKLENMHTDYKIRPELLKSKKYYENAFNTNVNYATLMEFKKELMK